MAYVAPSSTVILYANIPFDIDYDHTIDFLSISAQRDYFASRSERKVFSAVSYVRDGVVRLGVNSESIMSYNYMSFENSGYGGKTFYCFITDIRYVNNGCCEITYEVDELQTWIFDAFFRDCLVEREHVGDDTIGAHLLPEPWLPVETLPMASSTLYFTDWKVYVQAASSIIDQDKGLADGMVIHHQYTGAKFFVCDLDATQINDTINSLLRDGYKIISLYGVPDNFDSPLPTPPFEPYTNAPERPTSFKVSTDETSYIPINNKLLTYPYIFLEAQTGKSSCQYRYENFINTPTDTSVIFAIYFSTINAVSCTLTPHNYLSLGKEMDLSITSFPMYSWSENTVLDLINGDKIAGSISALGAGAAAGPVGAVTATIGVGADILGDFLKPTPTNVKGNTGSTYTDVTFDRFGYNFVQYGMRAAEAKRIDSLFSRYGYRVDTYKTPQWRSRPAFNYIKTKDCSVVGNLPTSAIKKIQDVFDKGITFWHLTDRAVTYDMENRPEKR